MKLKNYKNYYFSHYILSITFSIFIMFLIVFSNKNVIAAKESLKLWTTCIIPSLFPFFVSVELLQYTNIYYICNKLFNKIMRPIFNVPGEASYALIMGIISGSPIGAKIVTNLYELNICTKEEANRLLIYTNNSNPVFIISSIGISLYKNSSIGIILFISQILSILTIGIILNKIISNKKLLKKQNTQYTYTKLNTEKITNIGTILTNSITAAIQTTLNIGGFILLFGILLSIINNLQIINLFEETLKFVKIPHEFTNGIITGLIEMTNGINKISQIKTKSISSNIIITAFLIGFSGLSIIFQVNSIINKKNLSIKPYIIGKLFQGELSAFYTSLILKLKFFNLDFVTNQTIKEQNYITLTLFICILLTLKTLKTKKEIFYGI